MGKIAKGVNSFFIILGDILIWSVFLIFSLMVLVFQVQDNFNPVSFWSSPLVYILLTGFLLSAYLKKKNLKYITQNELSQILRSFTAFFWFQVQAIITAFWIGMIMTSGSFFADFKLRSIIGGIIFGTLWFGLFGGLPWLGYLKAMRSRILKVIQNDLRVFAEEKGGGVLSEGPLAEFIHDTESLGNGDNLGYFSVITGWKNPEQGLLLHVWSETTSVTYADSLRYSQLTGNDSLEAARAQNYREDFWTFGVFGKINPDIKLDDGVYNPSELNNILEDEDSLLWNEIVLNWKIEKLEINKDNYLVTWKAPFDKLLLRLKQPSIPDLDLLVKNLDKILGRR